MPSIKKRNDTQTTLEDVWTVNQKTDFGLGLLVPILFDGEKCKFPMLQLNLLEARSAS